MFEFKNTLTLFPEKIRNSGIFMTRDMLRILSIYRGSRQEVFCRKGALRIFAKFTEKNLCQSLFLNKVADLRPATLLNKRLWHKCFPVNFANFLRTFVLLKHLRRLLLNIPCKNLAY